MGMKAHAFTLISASLLEFIRGICKDEWSEWSSVKKMALFDHREFVIFRNEMNARSEPDSYRAVTKGNPFRESRHERFLVSFFANKKGKSIVMNSIESRKLKDQNYLWVPAFAGMTYHEEQDNFKFLKTLGALPANDSNSTCSSKGARASVNSSKIPLKSPRSALSIAYCNI